jgi:cytochrome c-type biogenesis protein CcmF
MERNRRRYGGYVVHAGFVVMFMGFAGAAYDVEEQVSLRPGEQMRIASPFGHTYTLTYQAMSAYPAPNMTKIVSSVSVAKDGKPAGVLTAEKRSYRQREEVASEVGIRRAWNEDLYLILAGIEDINGVVQGTNPRPVVTFRVLVQPLVPWIWIGGFIMAVGTLLALWPGAEPARPNLVRQKVRAPQRTPEAEPELVEA